MEKGRVCSFNTKTNTGQLVADGGTIRIPFRYSDGREVRLGPLGPELKKAMGIQQPKAGDEILFQRGTLHPQWCYESAWKGVAGTAAPEKYKVCK